MSSLSVRSKKLLVLALGHPGTIVGDRYSDEIADNCFSADVDTGLRGVVLDLPHQGSQTLPIPGWQPIAD